MDFVCKLPRGGSPWFAGRDLKIDIGQARDCLISAGQGRPLAVDMEDCELAPPCLEDFQDASSDATLFIAYVEISSILGHLTQHCRRKTLTRQIRQNIENQLYRWARDLPGSLRLFHSDSRTGDSASPKRLAPYDFEARQLHIPYFVCLAIMCRPDSDNSLSSAVILASSFIAGIFEDFLARDEIQFLGPIFTFHLLAAGIGLLSSNDFPSLWEQAAGSLETIYLALDVLAKRWSSAKGSLRALRSIAEKQQSTAPSDTVPIMTLSREHRTYFEAFGPELSWAWPYFMEFEKGGSNEGATIQAFGRSDAIDPLAESRPPDDMPAEYRPLTTVLDSNTGFAMGDMPHDMTSSFFHNQYQGMGDWLFKDLDWNGEITW